MLRVAFDPSNATVIYAVLGGFAGTGPPGHVFRTTLTAARWTDISPDLDAPFGALALDGQDTPTTIYVGTDVGGVLRSVDLGATWTVLDDLHFPGAAPTASTARGSRALICARSPALTTAAGSVGLPGSTEVSSSGACTRRADLAAAASPADPAGLATTTTGAEENSRDATPPATTSGAPASTDTVGAGTWVRAVRRT